ncbi:hypothetical protein Q3G72_017170 [Acer saccharum]|nr:hypothetical protein Q3G72_017170 [Acer saccharum]
MTERGVVAMQGEFEMASMLGKHVGNSNKNDRERSEDNGFDGANKTETSVEGVVSSTQTSAARLNTSNMLGLRNAIAAKRHELHQVFSSLHQGSW